MVTLPEIPIYISIYFRKWATPIGIAHLSITVFSFLSTKDVPSLHHLNTVLLLPGCGYQPSEDEVLHPLNPSDY